MTESGIPETAVEWAEWGAEWNETEFHCRWPLVTGLVDEIERLRATTPAYEQKPADWQPVDFSNSLGPPHSHWDPKDECVVNKREYEAFKADAEKWRKFEADTDRVGIPCTQRDLDAQLGALVRHLSGRHLVNHGTFWSCDYYPAVETSPTFDTPEEALRAVLGEE